MKDIASIISFINFIVMMIALVLNCNCMLEEWNYEYREPKLKNSVLDEDFKPSGKSIHIPQWIYGVGLLLPVWNIIWIFLLLLYPRQKLFERILKQKIIKVHDL